MFDRAQARMLRRRLLQAIPVLILATFFIFMLLKLLPGDVAITLAGENATEARISEIRALYESGKAGRWNPHRDIAWGALGADGYDEPVREAARRAWSRRIWVEAAGLTETPALLMRFCMEANREIDPKFYLTVRNTEEAWHVECLGGR